MAETFQETSVTLLQRIAVEKTGEDQAAWARFFELYEPAMLKFAEYHGGGAAARAPHRAPADDTARHGAGGLPAA